MIRRADVFTAAIQGDYGKPRPVVVIQSDLLEALNSVMVCPITSAVQDVDFRVTIEPDASNGLRKPSQVMTDKILTLPRAKLGQRLGRLDHQKMIEVNRALLMVMGLS